MPTIYHFTHGRNLERILATRELRCHARARLDTVVDIADGGVKRWREGREVTCGPGGCVGDYVPFYFAPRSPMLYKISKGEVAGVDRDQRPLVYVVSATEEIAASGLQCVFSDGNAAKLITDFFDDLELLQSRVDWAVMRARIWKNTKEDGDRMRRRMAEFLIYGAVPLRLVAEIGVYDDGIRERADQLVEGAGLRIPVNVRPDWYY